MVYVSKEHLLFSLRGRLHRLFLKKILEVFGMQT